MNLAGGIVQTALNKFRESEEICSEIKNRNEKKFGKSVEKFMDNTIKSIQEKNKNTYKLAQLIKIEGKKECQNSEEVKMVGGYGKIRKILCEYSIYVERSLYQ